MGEQNLLKQKASHGTLAQIKDFVVSDVYQDFKNEIEQMITYYHTQMEGAEAERDLWKYQGALGAIRNIQTLFDRLIEDLENP